jgi:hypothetical protein
LNFNLCRHIKTNGKRCKSPSLHQGALCYFHSRLFQRQDAVCNTPSFESMTTKDGAPCYPPLPFELDLPALEDRESIQVSISLIVAALAHNRIHAKRAAVLLYGLRMASINVRSIITEPPFAENVIRSVVPSEFHTDLAADPPTADSGSETLPDLPALVVSESPTHSNFSLSIDVIQEGVPEAK